jgi:D-sedoheptulose 7-phosphate isomerase
MTVAARPFTIGAEHVAALADALGGFAEQLERMDRWGRELADRLAAGGRLLAVGNGGSAAQAQHLTAEIVGRYHVDRPPFSAVALHTEPAALTAILNDYGVEQVFARQVAAHGRLGDVLIAMSTSGRSGNVLAAATTARELGVTTWAMTGPAPNPLAELADDALAVDASETAIVQELHLLALHLVCAAFDNHLLEAQEERVSIAAKRGAERAGDSRSREERRMEERRIGE